MIEVRSRGGCLIQVDDQKGMFGANPGQVVKIIDRGVLAVVLGAGKWPSAGGIDKLWVEEENGEASFLDYQGDFRVMPT